MNKELLSSLYECLERLNFSSISKLIKQKQVYDSAIPWNKFLAQIQTLSNCESMYYKHSYLSKANNIQDQYVQISNDLKSLLKPTGTASTTGQQQKQQRQDDDEYSFFSSLLLQTCILVQVRIDMIGVYTSLVLSINQIESNLDMLVNSLEMIPTIYRDKITHPLLLGMKTNTNYEISIIKNLLKVSLLLSKHVFKDSILLLYQSRGELDNWRDFDHSQSRTFDQKSGLVIWQSNYIHQWLTLFYNSLLARATLYFHFPLKTVEEETGGSMTSYREATMKNNPDYGTMIELFCQKSNAYFFGIFYECKGNPYSKIGYCFNNEDNIPTGLSSYPPLFYVPSDKQPTHHLPNIISILLENSSSLERPGDIFYYLDKQKTDHQGSTSQLHKNESLSDYTYFMVRIDTQLFITVIYKEIKKQKDVLINDFLKSMVSNLRNSGIFNVLRTKKAD